MIVIEGKKYSCDTCIKGHRSSACKHTERPLFEIQKKGRPVTQCTHCRELRKTKQVHIKCNCGELRPGKGESGSASKKIHDPAFPNGVPETLTAVVTLSSEHGSDSEHAANPKAGSCPCNPGGKCTCATPRKSKRNTGLEPPLDPSTAVRPSAGHEYRRVLPKPLQNSSPVSPNRQGPIHHPSSAGGGKQNPHPHARAEPLYSPYERAYDASHSHHTPPSDHSESGASPLLDVGPSPTSRVTEDRGGFDWSAYPAIPASSLCACGGRCSCSGCFEHRGPSAFQAYQGSSSSPVCANPRFCTSCVECAVILGHPDQQTQESGSFNTQASSFLDEWLRQLVEGNGNALPGTAPHPDTPVLGRLTQSPPNCCGGNCGCQPGFCVCVGECLGDCNDTWGNEGDATGMSIDPTSSLPQIGLDGGWDLPAGDQPWILTEPVISSDGSSDGEMMPGVNPTGDFNWGV